MTLFRPRDSALAGDPSHIAVAGSRVTAALYDPFLWLGERRGMNAQRSRLLRSATGRVIEIGAGTGLNLRHYPGSVEKLVLTEPSRPMAERLTARVAGLTHSSSVTVVSAPAESLPFASNSMDTVVSTLVLCTVADPARALAEIGRVLRPGGRLLFCEHIRSATSLGRVQDRLANRWAAIADGCQCNRDTFAAISAQLTITTIEHAVWRGMPPIVHPLIIGEASA